MGQARGWSLPGKEAKVAESLVVITSTNIIQKTTFETHHKLLCQLLRRAVQQCVRRLDLAVSHRLGRSEIGQLRKVLGMYNDESKAGVAIEGV